MKIRLKSFVCFLVASMILMMVPACSPKSEAPAPVANIPKGKPQFTIMPTDVAGIAQVSAKSLPGTNAGYLVHLQFTDAKAEMFREFTSNHINQQVQLLVGRHIVAEPVITATIPNGQADLTFSTPEEANAVSNLLASSLYSVTAVGAKAPHQTPPPDNLKTNR